MSELLAELAREVLLARRTAALQEIYEQIMGQAPEYVRLIGWGAVGFLELDEEADWAWQLRHAMLTAGFLADRLIINVQHRSIADEVPDGVTVDLRVPALIAAVTSGEWFIGLWAPFCLLPRDG